MDPFRWSFGASVCLKGPLRECRHMLHLSVVQDLKLGDALLVIFHNGGGVHLAGDVHEPAYVDD
jgi:hypothetical protein